MPRSSYDRAAPKRAANLTVNSDLLARARALNINLSQTLETSLSERVREAQRERWLAENREALEVYNRRIGKSGVFSDGLRRF